VITRFAAAFSLVLTPPPPLEPSNRVVFRRNSYVMLCMGLKADILSISVDYIREEGGVHFFPMIFQLLDFESASFYVRIEMFNCSLEHVDIIHSRDSIPPYDGVGPDPQDRRENCFGDSPG
jgi:hypothetical protein